MAACAMLMAAMLVMAVGSDAANTNGVYQPCADTKIQRSDGFTFGIAFSSKDNFYNNQSHQLSPCDRGLSLASLNSQLALFRPKVDEISLLSINTSSFFPVPFTSTPIFRRFTVINIQLMGFGYSDNGYTTKSLIGIALGNIEFLFIEKSSAFYELKALFNFLSKQALT